MAAHSTAKCFRSGDKFLQPFGGHRRDGVMGIDSSGTEPHSLRPGGRSGRDPVRKSSFARSCSVGNVGGGAGDDGVSTNSPVSGSR